jgi:hypothetical protein
VQAAALAAAWVIGTVVPAIVMFPARAAPVFASTWKATEPVPLPEPPLVMPIHGTLLAADHVHPEAVRTPIDVPAPPAAPIDCGAESIE